MSFQASIQVRETRNTCVVWIIRFDRTMNGMNTRTVRRDNYQTIEEIFPCPPISNRFILYSSFGQFGRFVFNAIDSNLGQLGNFNLNIFRRAIFFLFFLISHREILDIVLNNSKCGFRKIISRIFIRIFVRSYRDISRAAIGQFATNGHIAR